uniref:Uncharacterized protein n=1 Tax=Meloidogyne enterolobii TaxID=390850 RepID=A0A6V7VMM3_MELEN|nr:unnamed protein product [Meloidogyne enterolobii]
MIFSNYFQLSGMRLPNSSTAVLALFSLPALSSSSSDNLTNNLNRHSSNNIQPSPTSSSLLLPPFNASDSRLIAKCATRAQLKQRRNTQNDKTSFSTSLTLLERLGLGEEHNVEAPPISGLPIRQVRYEHAHRRGALYCQSGTWLEMTGDNEGRVNVRGTRNQNQLTIFEFLAVAFGLVSIRAVDNQHFLCMDSKGQLYAASENNFSAECAFLEEMHPQVYNLYSSCAHGYPKRPWFVALSRTGKPRRGKSTRRGQSSTHFVLIDGGGRQGNPLDSLGHARSRADWLINWRNFYEIDNQHKIRGRKLPPTTNNLNIKKPRLRWELIKSVDGGDERKRRSKISGKEK